MSMLIEISQSRPIVIAFIFVRRKILNITSSVMNLGTRTLYTRTVALLCDLTNLLNLVSSLFHICIMPVSICVQISVVHPVCIIIYTHLSKDLGPSTWAQLSLSIILSLLCLHLPASRYVYSGVHQGHLSKNVCICVLLSTIA